MRTLKIEPLLTSLGPIFINTSHLYHQIVRYLHYIDVIMSTTASQITSLAIVYSAVYSGADQRKHQSSASLAFVRGNHRWPVNFPHKGPVTRKMFPFDDVIMSTWPGDAVWHHRSWLTWFRVMSWYSLIVSEVLWHSLYCNFTDTSAKDIYHWYGSDNYTNLI